jgi:hypothetical protein
MSFNLKYLKIINGDESKVTFDHAMMTEVWSEAIAYCLYLGKKLDVITFYGNSCESKYELTPENIINGMKTHCKRTSYDKFGILRE